MYISHPFSTRNFISLAVINPLIEESKNEVVSFGASFIKSQLWIEYKGIKNYFCSLESRVFPSIFFFHLYIKINIFEVKISVKYKYFYVWPQKRSAFFVISKNEKGFQFLHIEKNTIKLEFYCQFRR